MHGQQNIKKIISRMPLLPQRTLLCGYCGTDILILLTSKEKRLPFKYFETPLFTFKPATNTEVSIV